MNRDGTHGLADFGYEICLNHPESPDGYAVAKLLMYQSGVLADFDMDEGSQIVIESCQLTVFGIRIVASLGEDRKTFYLKANRITAEEANG